MPVSKVKKSAFAIDVFDTKGKVKEQMSLPKEIFGVEVNKKLLAQAVRVYLANQRSGAASTKTRGEVTGSTRKIYRQKGTGRARHGGIRAPIFVHGGIAHGPKPKDHSLKFPQKMKKLALFSALSFAYQKGGLKIVSGLEKLPPKTKSMVEVLTRLSLFAPKKGLQNNILLVDTKENKNVSRAARNIYGMTITKATQLNTYEVLRHRTLLFAKDTINILAGQYLKKE